MPEIDLPRAITQLGDNFSRICTIDIFTSEQLMVVVQAKYSAGGLAPLPPFALTYIHRYIHTYAFSKCTCLHTRAAFMTRVTRVTLFYDVA